MITDLSEAQILTKQIRTYVTFRSITFHVDCGCNLRWIFENNLIKFCKFFCCLPFLYAALQYLFHPNVHLATGLFLHKLNQTYMYLLFTYSEKKIFPFNKFFPNNCNITLGRDSAVGVTPRYVLNGPRIESRWGRDRPWGPPSLLYDWYRVFPGGKAAGAWR